MKKLIAVAASACIFLSAQSAMAFTGQVNAGDFSSEVAAVAAGKQIAQKIEAGTYKIALNEVPGDSQIGVGLRPSAAPAGRAGRWRRRRARAV